MISHPVNKVKYLTNKDLLEEIHRSKKSFCSYLSEEYEDYDFIVTDLSLATPERIEQARKKKSDDRYTKLRKEALARGIKNPQIPQDLEEIKTESIVIRLMTFDHIPINEEKLHKAKTEAERHIRCNFPPFQHFIYRDGEFVCVGKSHWRGGLENGEFCNTHGKMSSNLAMMFMKLVERYSHRGNWRGYCIAETDEALTQRGWLGIDEINESDIILSYDQGFLKWSKIKSIYRGEYEGLMHKITNHTNDMLVTPGHKLVTDNGLIPVEYLTENQTVILMGNPIVNDDKIYSDTFVELAGWILTEGNYEFDPINGKLKRICIWQNRGNKADRIRNCLTNLGYRFSESKSDDRIIRFAICREHSREIQKTLPIKNLSMEFILKLTTNQRELLIDTMVDSDGHRVNSARKYGQKNKYHIDMFQALCTLAGHRTTYRLCKDKSYGEIREFYRMSILSPIKNQTKVSQLNLHGGKRNGRGLKNKDKINHPNVPTSPYKGRVWCPETEYGCFVARRNGKVYLTGNTYNEEMRGQALLQLSQMGLQFDESKSEQPNPFAYYTSVINNSFTRILNLEKRNQNIRDDLLVMNGAMPSYTRQAENDIKKSGTPIAAAGKKKKPPSKNLKS